MVSRFTKVLTLVLGPQGEANAYGGQLLVLQPGHAGALWEPELLGLSPLRAVQRLPRGGAGGWAGGRAELPLSRPRASLLTGPATASPSKEEEQVQGAVATCPVTTTGGKIGVRVESQTGLQPSCCRH